METTRKRAWTRQDLEAEYGIPAETWRYWDATRQGPRCARVGRRVYYDPAEVARWWAERTGAQLTAAAQ
jgi:hypothetical protein